MQCAACQRANPPDARFCGGCGSPLPLACPTCERANPPDASFCNGCGARLTPVPPVASAAAPRAYTPPHLAERILRTRGAIEGERKLVTVVFCDLADSTAVSERLGPEAMHEVMDRCIRLILEQVHRYEGTVNQFLGDGVMALFGAPLALEDAPRRAVVAALAIQRALVSLRRELATRFGVDFRMRIGVNSGPVIVGRIGDDLRMDYTAVGDTTNLADRLQKLAPPGGVLISDATHGKVQGWFEMRDLGAFEVKGKAAPVRAFEALAERAVFDRVAVGAETGLTPLVGRERELDALRDALAAAREGRGQVVFLVGEAGLGKSRLLHEFRRGLTDVTHAWFEGRCASYARTTPFHPVTDCLRHAFGLNERDDEASALAKLEAVEQGAGDALAWTLPFVRQLLSLPSGDEAVDRMDAATRRSETFRALRERMLRTAGSTLFVLVIEDLHWIDKASEEFLEFLTDSVPAEHALVLLTHRPGYRHPFGDRSFHRRLSLQALTERETERMASAVLEARRVPAELRALLAHKAEGNPFFVEEVTRSLLEEGALRRAGDEVELTRPSEDVRIPDRIQDVLMARLDRLDDAAKRALQIASVIGREFALRLLERIHETGAPLGPVVDELRALELIYEKARYPELAYMFKHALTHDVAYESVLASRRRALHLGVAGAIEELYRDRLAEHYETLARHYTEAEAWERALFYHERSSEKAAAAFANQAAAEHCRAALALAERAGEALSRDRRCALEERLGAVLFCLSEFPGSADAFERAVPLGATPDARGVDLSRAAHSRIWGHEYEPARRLIESAFEIANASPAPRTRAYAALVHGFGKSIFGDLDESERLSDDAGAFGTDDPEVMAVACLLVGEWAEWRGDWRLALEKEARAMEIARANHLPPLLVMAGWFHGKALCGLGDYRGALGSLREALEVCERIGDRAHRSRLLNTLGWLHAEIGDHEGALAFNQRSAEIAHEMVELKLVASAVEVWSNATINLAGDHLARGDFGAADELLARVRTRVEDESDPWMRWRYRLHLLDAEARLALARGAPEVALGLAREELDGARRHKARKLEARAQELAARALLVLEQRPEAEAELRAATATATAIGYAPVRWRALAIESALARRSGDGARAEQAAAAARALTAELAAGLPETRLRRALAGLGERLAADPLGTLR
jgi:class 3 adenylate cyclase/tetratricopeptide (TPR) repeat protein